MKSGLGGTWSGFSTSGGGPAAADVRPRAAPPPPQATSVRRAPPRTAATRTRALPCMCSPSLITRVRLGRTGSLATRPTSGRVVRRCTAGEPVPERVRILCQTPFLEDRQRHRPHSALARARRETLLLQPGLELVRRGVGGDGPLEQPSLDRETDRVGGRVALAPLAPPLRRLQGGEELAADCARAGRWAVAHAPPFPTPNANPSRGRRRSAIRASSAYPGRSGRW